MKMATSKNATPAAAATPKAPKVKRDPTLPKVSGLYMDLSAAESALKSDKNFVGMRAFSIRTERNPPSFILSVSRSQALRAAVAAANITVDGAGVKRKSLVDRLDSLTPAQLQELKARLQQKGV